MKGKKEIIIGLLILMSIIIGYVGLSFLKGINLFSKSNQYYTTFQDLNNVGVSTPIKISGYKVGNVRTVNFNYKKGQGAILELSIDPNVLIYKGSVIRMSVNPISGSELFIDPPKDISKGEINVGDTIASKESDGDILKMLTRTVTPMVTEIIPAINATIKKINTLADDRSISEAMKNLKNATHNIKIITQRLNSLSKTLPQIVDNVNGISNNILSITKEMQKIKVDSLMSSLNEAANTITYVSKQLKNKNNTTGLLINDTHIYYRLDSLIISADSLINDIKANPRKYINLSIF